VLANIWQLPSWLLNDPNGAAYNNMLEATKAIYTNRVIPDVEQFCAGFSDILQAYGGYKLKPDLSGIEALQEDKVNKVKWISQMFNDGAITGDQYLELLGMEATGLPEMQQRYTMINRVPLGYEDNLDTSNGDKFYKDHGLEGKM
jgi:phage portal protein BeeE